MYFSDFVFHSLNNNEAHTVGPVLIARI